MDSNFSHLEAEDKYALSKYLLKKGGEIGCMKLAPSNQSLCFSTVVVFTAVQCAYIHTVPELNGERKRSETATPKVYHIHTCAHTLLKIT